MKKFYFTILIGLLIVVPIQASPPRGLIGIAAIASVIALVAAANEGQCEVVSFDTHEKGVLYTETLGSAISDEKQNVCRKLNIKSVVESSDAIEIDTMPRFISEGEHYKVPIGMINVSGVELLNGKKPTKVWVTTDQDGIAIASDYKPFIGQKIVQFYNTVHLRDDSFSREIVFTGSHGDILLITYREFSGQLIRFPFTIELTIDLKKGDTFTIKEKKFKVHKVDNNGITYELL